jgi:ankyrin repeat protein
MYTGLMYACENGHVDIVNMQLQTEGMTKEWVDTVASDGNTALTLAASSRSIDCVSALISFGANVNQSDSGHISVLRCAEGNIPMLKMLLEVGAGDTPARHGQAERIDGRTALIDACEEQKAEAAQLLLKYKSSKLGSRLGRRSFIVINRVFLRLITTVAHC